MRTLCRYVLSIGLLIGGVAEAIELRTLAEQSAFVRTGRYDEATRLCADFEKAWLTQVRCMEFGRSPEGRAMRALVVSTDGVLTADAARRLARPVVVIQGGIHAGEIDGKDAGFLALRHMLEGRVAKGALQNVTLVFVPIFNVDGHERFGRNHRPNQIGPEEMGWRTTAQNLNLNRDYIKGEAPEMQAMLHLLNEWDPILYVDLHVTDGAEFQHDISVNVSPTLVGDPHLQREARALRFAVMKHLSNNGSSPLPFYPTLVRDDDPSSGFADSISPPRFSHEYWALRNRIGVLVETHSWKNYKTRVLATYQCIVSLLTQAAEQGRNWHASALEAEQQARTLGGNEVALGYTNTEHSRLIEFRGYRYTREPSEVSGALMTHYDRTHPEIWRVPFFDEVRPSILVAAPKAGYIVPAAWANLVAAKLALHAIDYSVIANAFSARLQTYRAASTRLSSLSNEGRATLTALGEWQEESREVPAGSLFVPIAQPRAQLAMTLLEPKSNDSLLAWGFFNAAFERKEYMEAYVAEAVAREMLSRDPALKAEFERRLKEDPAFAKNPQARLEFFYRRHPSWDERFNLYPVYRTATLP